MKPRPIHSPARATAFSPAARARGNCPKVIHTNTSTEYWQSGQSLIVTDPLGRRDGSAPETFASIISPAPSTSKSRPCRRASAPPPTTPSTTGRCCAPRSPALDRWVKDGTPPPPSRHPRLVDGTLVEMTSPDVAIPGLHCGEGTEPAAPLRLRPRLRQGYHQQDPAGCAQGQLPGAGARGRRRRQRDERHPAARHRRPDRDDHRMGGSQRQRRARRMSFAISTARRCRSRGPKRNVRRRGHAPLAGRALPRRRRLRREGAQGSRRLGAGGISSAGRRATHRRPGGFHELRRARATDPVRPTRGPCRHRPTGGTACGWECS